MLVVNYDDVAGMLSCQYTVPVIRKSMCCMIDKKVYKNKNHKQNIKIWIISNFIISVKFKT